MYRIGTLARLSRSRGWSHFCGCPKGLPAKIGARFLMEENSHAHFRASRAGSAGGGSTVLFDRIGLKAGIDTAEVSGPSAAQLCPIAAESGSQPAAAMEWQLYRSPLANRKLHDGGRRPCGFQRHDAREGLHNSGHNG